MLYTEAIMCYGHYYITAYYSRSPCMGHNCIMVASMLKLGALKSSLCMLQPLLPVMPHEYNLQCLHMSPQASDTATVEEETTKLTLPHVQIMA